MKYLEIQSPGPGNVSPAGLAYLAHRVAPNAPGPELSVVLNI